MNALTVAGRSTNALYSRLEGKHSLPFRPPPRTTRIGVLKRTFIGGTAPLLWATIVSRVHGLSRGVLGYNRRDALLRHLRVTLAWVEWEAAGFGWLHGGGAVLRPQVFQFDCPHPSL